MNTWHTFRRMRAYCRSICLERLEDAWIHDLSVWLCTRYPEQPYFNMISSSSTTRAPLISPSIMANDFPSLIEQSLMFLPSFFVPISIGRKPMVGTEFGVSACTQSSAGHKPLMSNPPKPFNHQALLHMMCTFM
jgi:hypothetical protein